MIYHKTQSGFSLVEMLVAVSVLLIVIVGPMTVTSRVAKSSSFATEQVQAFFLAQEGLEIAEKQRDELMLRHFNSPPPSDPSHFASPWGTFTNTSGTYANCFAGTGCGVDWSSATALSSVRSCATISNCKLRYKPSAARSKYTYDTTGTSEETPFTRVVTFSPAGAGILVTSKVTWRTGSIAAEQKVESSTYLYNIYDKP